ncbi:hypothetical protein HHI36_020769 [Cryptolaemus montrouzieri]|uniref:Uncharacterized protein n=1 Tax=Cryptolaemus montrouzieri TaxID=559131 RepID=A0ABD2NC32_9CUCU
MADARHRIGGRLLAGTLGRPCLDATSPAPPAALLTQIETTSVARLHSSAAAAAATTAAAVDDDDDDGSRLRNCIHPAIYTGREGTSVVCSLFARTALEEPVDEKV